MAIDAIFADVATSVTAISQHGPDDQAPWATKGACKGTDVKIFFSKEDADQRTALRLCAMCDVREVCLTDALDRRERYGTWGGMTEGPRRALLRRPSQAA